MEVESGQTLAKPCLEAVGAGDERRAPTDDTGRVIDDLAGAESAAERLDGGLVFEDLRTVRDDPAVGVHS